MTLFDVIKKFATVLSLCNMMVIEEHTVSAFSTQFVVQMNICK